MNMPRLPSAMAFGLTMMTKKKLTTTSRSGGSGRTHDYTP
jgi:hypothetical protein